jgi:hypothetical protein
MQCQGFSSGHFEETDFLSQSEHATYGVVQLLGMLAPLVSALQPQLDWELFE